MDSNKLIGYKLDKFPKIADKFDRLEPGFYIIAADSKLCLDLLESNPNVKVIYFSLDDSLVETSYRFLGILADLPINTIKLRWEILQTWHLFNMLINHI